MAIMAHHMRRKAAQAMMRQPVAAGARAIARHARDAAAALSAGELAAGAAASAAAHRAADAAGLCREATAGRVPWIDRCGGSWKVGMLVAGILQRTAAPYSELQPLAQPQQRCL